MPYQEIKEKSSVLSCRTQIGNPQCCQEMLWETLWQTSPTRAWLNLPGGHTPQCGTGTLNGIGVWRTPPARVPNSPVQIRITLGSERLNSTYNSAQLSWKPAPTNHAGFARSEIGWDAQTLSVNQRHQASAGRS